MARDAPSIDGYGEGGFRVAGVWRPGSLLIVNDAAQDWAVTTPAELTPNALAPVLLAGRAAVEFLVLGMGAMNALPPRELRETLARTGIGLEFLDTPGAAQLYNVLTSEGRQIACALIAL